jgi:ATP-dependent Clp protease adaptor protein ClpS
MTTPVELEQTQVEPSGAEIVSADRPWETVVWNDPVNLMSYVTYVFQKLFGYSKEQATKLMLDVHHKGKAIVSSGTKEKVEGDVARLHAAGLWATMQHES